MMCHVINSGVPILIIFCLDDDTITLDDDFLQDEDQQSKATSIPIASYFILVTELCERFAYYGIVAVLQVSRARSTRVIILNARL